MNDEEKAYLIGYQDRTDRLLALAKIIKACVAVGAPACASSSTNALLQDAIAGARDVLRHESEVLSNSH